MPRGNGTGPLGRGPGTGKGMGGCRGGGRGTSRGAGTGGGPGIGRGGNIPYRKISSRRASAASGKKAVIEIEKCIACGVCADVCSENAISMDKVAVIDNLKCIGCGMCVEVCPQGAIAFQ